MLSSSQRALTGTYDCTALRRSRSLELTHRQRCSAARRPRLQEGRPDLKLPAKDQSGDNGTSNGLGKASPDVLRLFSETQRNLLELNRSRLSALDELRIAKCRIADLESQLEKAYKDQGTAETAPQQSPERQSQEPLVSTTSQQAVEQSVITVAYETGWDRVMMHYCADSQWSKCLQIRANCLEFVLNDGAGQWDTPDPYGSSQTKNYVIDTPGKYRLKAGKISQVL